MTGNRALISPVCRGLKNSAGLGGCLGSVRDHFVCSNHHFLNNLGPAQENHSVCNKSPLGFHEENCSSYLLDYLEHF